MSRLEHRREALEKCLQAMLPFAHLALCDDMECQNHAEAEGFDPDIAWQMVADLGLLIHLIGVDDAEAIQIMSDAVNQALADAIAEQAAKN